MQRDLKLSGLPWKTQLPIPEEADRPKNTARIVQFTPREYSAGTAWKKVLSEWSAAMLHGHPIDPIKGTGQHLTKNTRPYIDCVFVGYLSHAHCRFGFIRNRCLSKPTNQ